MLQKWTIPESAGNEKTGARVFFPVEPEAEPAYKRAMTQQDVIILGAGASGLYCGLHAARQGLSVTLVDHGPKPGRKVRIAGGGRCNFTNLHTSAEHFISANPHFCKSALARHTPWDVVAFFAEHGIGYEEKADGQLFSDSGGGRVAGVLAEQCHRAGARILCERSIVSVQGTGPFMVKTDRETLCAPRLVLALGGKSWPQAGASGLGYDLARQFGLQVTPLRPGLVSLVLGGEQGALCRRLAGVALPATVHCAGREFADDLLFTHKGVSGPAVMRAASLWTKGASVVVNLLPGVDLDRDIQDNRTRSLMLRNYLQSLLPKRMILEWFPKEFLETPISQVSNKLRQDISRRIHHWEFVPQATEGWRKAEVTVGGVDTAQISSKTMEAKAVPGLYVPGELLDVTGDLGGHNLHWAWASGHAAAMSMV
jgi:hypothetical protein